MLKRTALCLTVALPAPAFALEVAADIAPIHSLVVQVMQGTGTPTLLIDPSADPHTASLRPSDAKALEQAEVVFTLGEELTPWLPRIVETLAPNAKSVSLLEHAAVLIEFDEPHDHGAHDDHDAHGEHDDHDAHADHADHADHEKHADHDDHHAEHKDEEHADHDEHGHEDHAEHVGEEAHYLDPHAWLDLRNADAWVTKIAQTLIAADPENAKTYKRNAAAAQERIAKLEQEMEDILSSANEISYLAYHDAYGYFASHWGLESEGSLSSNEGAPPSAGDMRRAQDLIADGHVTCVLTEQQFPAKVTQVIVEGTNLPVVETDPLGARQVAGADLYPNLMAALATDVAGCVPQSG